MNKFAGRWSEKINSFVEWVSRCCISFYISIIALDRIRKETSPRAEMNHKSGEVAPIKISDDKAVMTQLIF